METVEDFQRLEEGKGHLGQVEVGGDLVQARHLRPVGKLLEEAQPARQRLLDLGALLARLQLLQFLDVLVQLQVVQNHRHEQAQHDLPKKPTTSRTWKIVFTMGK